MIVIIDINTPGMNGFKFFEAVRAYEREMRATLPRLRDVPLIFTASHPNEQVIKQANESGIPYVL